MKKSLITIGSITASIIPVAVVVSCGSDNNDSKTPPVTNPAPVTNPVVIGNGYTTATYISGKLTTYTKNAITVTEASFESDILAATVTGSSIVAGSATFGAITGTSVTAINTINRYWIIDANIAGKQDQRMIFLDTDLGLVAFKYSNQASLSDRVDHIMGNTNMLPTVYNAGTEEITFKGSASSLELWLKDGSNERKL